MTTIEIQANKPIDGELPQGGQLSIWLIGVFALLGILFSAITIPILLPGLVGSISGAEPKVFWYLSRGTAIVSYLFLWISMVLGLLITSKTAKYFPGAYTANDLHQFISINGLITGLLHGMLLLGDKYFKVNVAQVFIPFSISTYRPIWVGLGQIAFYIWGILVLSFYLKKHMGYKTWRAMHFVSFLIFAGVLMHGITSGTDTTNLVMQFVYWVSGGSVVLLTFYRILAKVGN